jgi:cobyrinic acid a,c-diamide synthase
VRLAKGLLIAAPQSGSGKTVVTLGILRALKDRGVKVASAKAGPDYIDPRFHEAATGRRCFNLDPWAMSIARIRSYLDVLAEEADVVIIEGVMGLFDGPRNCAASTHDLARELDLPLLVVVDCSHLAQSVGPLMAGLQNAAFRRPGIILNRVASSRHESLLRDGLEQHLVSVIGCVYRDRSLELPSRHLGLVQAAEHSAIEPFIQNAATVMERSMDIDGIVKLCAEFDLTMRGSGPVAPIGQRVAIASDQAFAFSYPHILSDWRAQGAEVLPFSPLADEPPPVSADAIFLPGGYPELHGGKLAGSASFLSSLRLAAEEGKLIYGECGGFMVLGEYLIDAEGRKHAMAGLLPLGTNFACRKLHLGYRGLVPIGRAPWPVEMRAHEFHYSTIDWQGEADPLFGAKDATGEPLGNIGLRRANVMGSYAHVIAPEAG